MEILEELPLEQWPLLQEKLKLLWPLNAPGYYTLHVYSKYPGLRETFKFKVYCPYGNIENGFLAINTKDYQHVVIFSFTEDTSEIEMALLKTRLIDWNKPAKFDSLTYLTLPVVKRVHDVMQFERFFVMTTAKMYHLAGTTKPFTDFKLPDKTIMKSVKSEYIQRVDDTWPFKYPNSYIYFAALASNGLSYGPYSSDTDELLAWIFINEYNCLSHMFCEEKYRRRGYGQYLMQCVVNDLLKDGNDVFGYVVDGNEKPLSIFAKFGFKAADNAAFITVEKPVNKA